MKNINEVIKTEDRAFGHFKGVGRNEEPGKVREREELVKRKFKTTAF